MTKRKKDDHVPHIDLDPEMIEGFRILRGRAEMYFDFQQTRVGCENRIKRGPVDASFFANEFDVVRETEHNLAVALVKQWKEVVPLAIREWVDATKGLGPHTMARLLGHVGHPRYGFPQHWEGMGEDRHLVADDAFLRTVGDLWSYCGHGEVLGRRRGMTVEDALAAGNPKAKMVTHLLAESAVKEPGRDKTAWGAELSEKEIAAKAAKTSRSSHRSEPMSGTTGKKRSGGIDGQMYAETHTAHAVDATWPYRKIYEERRRVTLDRVHAEPCVRCGPSGKPAQSASPWSDAHRHADGLRLVGKAILKDLWLAAAS